MKRRSVSHLLAGLIVGQLLLLTGCGSAPSGVVAQEAAKNPTVGLPVVPAPDPIPLLPLPNSAVEELRKKFPEMVRKAEQGGEVQVIVGLVVTSNDQGAIALAQTNLLDQMQKLNLKVTGVKSFNIPFMAMTVDLKGLTFLATSSLVSSIEEDAVVHLTNP